jgi:hypothetical protein
MEAFSTRSIRTPALFQARLPTDHDAALVSAALDIKAQNGLPFMDAINLALIRGARYDDAILHNIAFQNHAESSTWHPISHSSSLSPVFTDDDQAAMTALASEVRLRSGDTRHLAMLDFQVPASDEVLDLVRSAAFCIGGPGWVLASGRSYHYYGRELLTFSEMCAFLGRGLLFAPITDRAWVAHQLVDGACCLRIGGHPTKAGTPTVVADFSE